MRVRKRKGFTIISNRPANDPALSAGALGVLTYLMTKPDGWQVREVDVRRRFQGRGHDWYLRIMRELRAGGYVWKDRYRDDRGRWRYQSYIMDDPDQAPAVGLPDNGRPVDGSAADGPAADGQADRIVKTELVKTESVKTEGPKTEGGTDRPADDLPIDAAVWYDAIAGIVRNRGQHDRITRATLAAMATGASPADLVDLFGPGAVYWYQYSHGARDGLPPFAGNVADEIAAAIAWRATGDAPQGLTRAELDAIGAVY